jgi:hypothetical protein
MSIQQVQIGYSASLAVRLLDGSDDPVMGITYDQLTVRYKKQGGSWTVKSVQVAEWTEGADGRYMLVFSAEELDTEGKFVFLVEAPGATTMTGDIDIVLDWATTVDMLTTLLNGLASKVTSSSASLAKQQQDEAIEALNDRVDTVSSTISWIKDQLTVILTKLKTL